MYLQYERLLISQQREAFDQFLDQFLARLREKFLLRGPPPPTEMKLCKGSSFAVLSDVSDLINGPGSIVSVMFNGLAKEKRDVFCLWHLAG
jgi:hypothetical protein